MLPKHSRSAWHFYKLLLRFARATSFEAHVYPYKGVDIKDIINKMDYDPLTLKEASTELPLKVFQAHQPQSKKYITLAFEPVSEETVNVVVSGNTWAFRDQLEAHGCPGARMDNESRTYYRYMTDVDLANDKQKILGLFDIFHNQVVRVIVDPEPEPGCVADFLDDELKGYSCCHFA